MAEAKSQPLLHKELQSVASLDVIREKAVARHHRVAVGVRAEVPGQQTAAVVEMKVKRQRLVRPDRSTIARGDRRDLSRDLVHLARALVESENTSRLGAGAEIQVVVEPHRAAGSMEHEFLEPGELIHEAGR